jgi:Putative Ig domain/Domain of unknown function DUF11
VLAAAVAAAGAGALVAAPQVFAAAAPVCSAGTCTVQFTESGAPATWSVPAGVTSATVTLYGGRGGDGGDLTSALGKTAGGAGGAGAEVTATLALSGVTALTLNVGAGGGDAGYGGGGAAGDNGAFGGGGGGATTVSAGAGTLLVAGGGGGGGNGGDPGLSGGAGGTGGNAATSGGAAEDNTGPGLTLTGAGGGGAGTESAGGGGGGGGGVSVSGSCAGDDSFVSPGEAGTPGSAGQGGGGADGGAGGGGGYYGGGQGGQGGWGPDVSAACDFSGGQGGGGGGSSFTGGSGVSAASVNDSPSDAPADGNGEAVISFAVPPLSVMTLSLPGVTQGTVFSQQLAASGGVAPYTWAPDGGQLPAGLALSAAGLLSGTPTAAGSFGFTVEVTDAVGQTETQQLALTVNPAAVPPLAITTSGLPGGIAGTAYSQALSAAGGTTPYTWSLAGGSLPAGLTLAKNGIVAGTPRAAGTSSFTVKVTDTGNPAKTVTAQLSVTVVADKADVSVSVRGPASAKAGTVVTDTITVTNKGPVEASEVKVGLDSAGLAGVKASAGGSTKSVTVLGVTLAATSWSVPSLEAGQAVTFSITGTVPAKRVKTATAAGLARSATADPSLLNNAGLVSTRITS